MGFEVNGVWLYEVSPTSMIQLCIKNSTNRVECQFKDFYYIWIRDSEVAAVSSYEVGESLML